MGGGDSDVDAKAARTPPLEIRAKEEALAHPIDGCVETSAPRPGYRPCVGIFLLDRQKRVFVGQRADVRQEAWQLPQGGIDAGEKPREAGLREMFEEIGTDRAICLRESRTWRSYDLPVDLAARMWGGRYKGQTQLWIAYRFEGDEGDIDLTGDHQEFLRHRWIDPRTLIELTVPFKRGVYGAVLAEFGDLWAP